MTYGPGEPRDGRGGSRYSAPSGEPTRAATGRPSSPTLRRPGHHLDGSAPGDRPTREIRAARGSRHDHEVRDGYTGLAGEDPGGSEYDDRPPGRGAGHGGRRLVRPPGQVDRSAGPVSHTAPGRRRRGRAVVITAVLVIATVLAGGAAWRTGLPARVGAYLATPTTTPRSGGPSPSPAGGPAGSPASAGAAAVVVPQKGAGTFGYAGTQGAVLGTGGNLKRFRVAAENGLGQDPNVFATAIDRILGDPRSWTSGAQFRFQRVPQSATADFTIFLASPDTSEMMCAAGGLYTEKFTNCRLVGQVVINLARWLTSVPDYGAPLDVYQAYAINHEVGHELGLGHEACPGPGSLAPVMQAQTYGLKGCLANAWPYIDGKRYSGEVIP